MKPEQLMVHFEELAERLDIKIVKGRGDFIGGSCIVNGQHVVVINSVKPLLQRCKIMAGAFAELDLSGIYVVPVLRDLITEIRDEYLDPQPI